MEMKTKTPMFQEFTKGLFRENPILIIMLGLCGGLAASSNAVDGAGMGAAFAFVMICSNVVVSLIRRITPSQIRIPVFITVISTFVTIVDYAMKAYTPALSRSLGVFVPLIVVNCIVMGRAEAFASKNGVLRSLLDGIGMSIGFGVVITLMGAIREFLGAGTLFNRQVLGDGLHPRPRLHPAAGRVPRARVPHRGPEADRARAGGEDMISQDMNLFLIFLSAMIVNNILLIRFIALCSFFGISNNIQTSIGMGMAVLFVMVMASSISWVIYHFILVPFDLLYLRTAAFILTIATFVQLEEMAIRKMFPALYRAMGIYLPLIVVNCAVLAAAFLIIDYNLSFIKSLVYTVGVAAGYFVSIVLFAAIRERVSLAPVSRSFQGYPIAFITASLMSLAFLGFKGLFGL